VLACLHRPPPRATLFPYTTLFRSAVHASACHTVDFSKPAPGREGAGARRLLVELEARFSHHLGSVLVPGADFSCEFFRGVARRRSEEHTSELQSRENLVCRLLLEK